MTRHSYIIDNGPGAAVRTEINKAYDAIRTNNSGSGRPESPKPYEIWIDSDTDEIFIRNGEDDRDIRIGNVGKEGFGINELLSPITSDIDIIDTSSYVEVPDGSALWLSFDIGADITQRILGRSLTSADMNLLRTSGGGLTNTLSDFSSSGLGNNAVYVILRVNKNEITLNYGFKIDTEPDIARAYERNLFHTDSTYNYFTIGRYELGLTGVALKRTKDYTTAYHGILGKTALDSIPSIRSVVSPNFTLTRRSVTTTNVNEYYYNSADNRLRIVLNSTDFGIDEDKVTKNNFTPGAIISWDTGSFTIVNVISEIDLNEAVVIIDLTVELIGTLATANVNTNDVKFVLYLANIKNLPNLVYEPTAISANNIFPNRDIQFYYPFNERKKQYNVVRREYIPQRRLNFNSLTSQNIDCRSITSYVDNSGRVHALIGARTTLAYDFILTDDTWTYNPSGNLNYPSQVSINSIIGLTSYVDGSATYVMVGIQNSAFAMVLNGSNWLQDSSRNLSYGNGSTSTAINNSSIASFVNGNGVVHMIVSDIITNSAYNFTFDSSSNTWTNNLSNSIDYSSSVIGTNATIRGIVAFTTGDEYNILLDDNGARRSYAFAGNGNTFTYSKDYNLNYGTDIISADTNITGLTTYKENGVNHILLANNDAGSKSVYDFIH